jgi:D-alanine-D-alanine ligase
MAKIFLIYNDIPDRTQQTIELKSELSVVEVAIDVDNALLSKGHEVIKFPFTGDVIFLMEEVQKVKPDAVFNLFEGAYGMAKTEVFVPIAMELLGISYTGSQPKTLETCVQKAKTKKILKEHNVSTPAFQKFDIGDRLETTLRFPVIVKPEQEDASIGISNRSVVRDEAMFAAQVQFIWQTHKQPALVEEFVDGREFNVALLGDETPVVLPVSEISFATMPEGYERIVSYNAKWEETSVEYHETKPVCPANLDAEMETKLKNLACQAWNAMGCRDYARVDMRLSAADGTPYVIDVNPNPDISPEAGFARSAKAYGLDYASAIDAIAMFAVHRAKRTI